MRILQGRIIPSYIKRSDDPARSLQAFVVGSQMMEVLLDDQGITTKINNLIVHELDEDAGIVFAAKDSETLIRGFKYLASSKNNKISINDPTWLQERGRQNLAALAICWSEGVSRHNNKAAAAFITVGHNFKQVLARGLVGASLKISPGSKSYWQNTGIIDRFESVSQNMQSAGRDGRMITNGAALYVCSGVQLPLIQKWGCPYRQIEDTLTYSQLGRIATKLFA